MIKFKIANKNNDGSPFKEVKGHHFYHLVGHEVHCFVVHPCPSGELYSVLTHYLSGARACRLFDTPFSCSEDEAIQAGKKALSVLEQKNGCARMLSAFKAAGSLNEPLNEPLLQPQAEIFVKESA